MSVVEDMVAAKSLISNEADWRNLKATTGSAIAHVFYSVAGADEGRVNELFNALHDAWSVGAAASHSGTIAAFDRAIAASTPPSNANAQTGAK